MPARLIAENSGTDGSIIVGKLMDSKDANYGYDAQKGEFTDMITGRDHRSRPRSCGTPSRMPPRSPGLLVTTEAMVAEKPEPKAARRGCRRAAAWAAWAAWRMDF